MALGQGKGEMSDIFGFGKLHFWFDFDKITEFVVLVFGI